MKKQPDKDTLVKIIKRETVPDRAHFAELHIDAPILKAIAADKFGLPWLEPAQTKTRQERAGVLDMHIACLYRLGYDYVRLGSDFRFDTNLKFGLGHRSAADTAAHSKGERKWVEQRQTVMETMDDFERYPWPSAETLDLWTFEYLSAHLPEGMGFFACFSQGIMEVLANELFGIESLSFLIYEQPDLLEAVVKRAGDTIYRAFERIIGLPNLIGFFQGDDLGYKQATMLSPATLRKYILPWHKKIAALAHKHGLVYVLHSCGNLESIMGDLIDDVKIDAKHSFEDAIMPVAEFKKKYGGRVAVMGGVDMDKLCRMSEPEVRSYVRKTLDDCMPGGGYLLGSGNTIANYMPVGNYLAMLDEGEKWKKP